MGLWTLQNNDSIINLGFNVVEEAWRGFCTRKIEFRMWGRGLLGKNPKP